MLGLKELISRSKPDECPFCGESRARQGTKPPLTCGDEICRRAYHVFYGRDRRSKLTQEQKDERNRKRREMYRRNKNK